MAAAVLILLNCEPLLRLLFGKVEPEVMAACITYLKISAYSYPALAVYNAGAALYRSFGKTSTTMYISIASNCINVVGNCIGVFVLKAGVAGVAWPSLFEKEPGFLLLAGTAPAGREVAGKNSAHCGAQRL